MMRDKGDIKVGSIVQIDPTIMRGDVPWAFAGCLVIVTEVKHWGIQGYAIGVGADGRFYVRVEYGQFEPTGGEAAWMVGEA